MEMWLQDIRYGLRTLRKSPGFTAIAVAVLALGIGANTAIFSIADALLLKPLNLPDTDHLVVMLEKAPTETIGGAGVSPADFDAWREQAKSFEGISAWMWGSVSLTGIYLPEQIQGYKVTTNFFELCGTEPLLGRTFTESEDQPGEDGEVILSYRLWQRRFAGDRAVIGQVIHLDRRAYTVIGVMPQGFRFPIDTELWTPLALLPSERASRTWHSLYVLGKLNPGTTVQRANAEMDTISRRLGESYPNTNRGWGVQLTPIRRFSVGENAYEYTYLLLGAVGFVLLIVCANVGNLQFVRGAKRVKEVAIRTAMGGSRWRIVRQLLTESMMLALVGAALGVLLAEWTVHLMIAGMPQDVARTIAGFDAIRVDARALGFTIVVAVASGMLAGLFPALQSTRVRMSETLKEGGRGGTSGKVRQRLRGALVMVQVALAVVLLAGAGLIVRGFRAIQNSDARYKPESLLTMVLTLPAGTYGGLAQSTQFVDRALNQLASLPGASGAAVTTIIPHTIGNSNSDFVMQGRPWQNAGEARTADLEIISPNYFHVMGVPIIEGREFTDADSNGNAEVAIISQSLAKAYWPKESPIGHGIKFGHYESKYPWATIVGVVADMKQDWADISPSLAVYRPYRQISRAYMSFVLRSGGSAEGLIGEARMAMAAVDPEISLMNLKPMSEVIKDSLL